MDEEFTSSVAGVIARRDHAALAKLLEVATAAGKEINVDIVINGVAKPLAHQIAQIGVAGAKCLQVLTSYPDLLSATTATERECALHVAARGVKSRSGILKEEGMAVGMILLNSGVKLHPENSQMKTPLHIAASQGNTAFMAMLHNFETKAKLQRRPSDPPGPNELPAWDALFLKDNEGNYPLTCAVRAKAYQSVDWIIRHQINHPEYWAALESALKQAVSIADSRGLQLILRPCTESPQPNSVHTTLHRMTATTCAAGMQAFRHGNMSSCLQNVIMTVMLRSAWLRVVRSAALSKAMFDTQRARDLQAHELLTFAILWIRLSMRYWRLTLERIALSLLILAMTNTGELIWLVFALSAHSMLHTVRNSLLAIFTAPIIVASIRMLTSLSWYSWLISVFSFVALRIHTSPTIFTKSDDAEQSLEFCRKAYYQGLSYGVDSCLLRNGYCWKCEVARPERTSHCWQCDTCVRDFDHHCTWTNCDVTSHNLLYFFAFLVGSVASVVLSCVLYLLVWVSGGFYVSSSPWFALVWHIVAACMGAFGAKLIGQQYEFLRRGLTSHEARNYKRFTYLHKDGKFHNPYHHGSILNNLKAAARQLQFIPNLRALEERIHASTRRYYVPINSDGSRGSPDTKLRGNNSSHSTMSTIVALAMHTPITMDASSAAIDDHSAV